MNLKSSFIIFNLIFLMACGGGGGGEDDSALLNNNACDLLATTRTIDRSKGNVDRIVNGGSCNTQSGPIVRLLLLSSDGSTVSVCTGTMITQRKVLSAAHCFIDAVSAVINLDNKNIQGVFVSIHPLYESSEYPDNAFDIAVLELGEAANQPTLPILVGREIEEGEIAGIFGYGQTVIASNTEGDAPNSLISGDVIVRDVEDFFYRSEFQGAESNACFGDSGGPLAVQHLGRTAVAGTTSFGTNDTCAEGDKGAYNRLQEGLALEFLSVVAADAEYL